MTGETLFQSTLPCGSDERSAAISRYTSAFQSTLPRGSDDCTPSRAQAFCHTFQSTLPHGSDAERPAQYAVKCYFIPRSLAGATLILFGYDFKSDHFNPRSLAGATRKRKNTKTMLKISIHAPSREQPAAFREHLCRQDISIHAPSRERP